MTTDKSGEALLEAGDGACKVYVFMGTTLLKSACSKSEAAGSSTGCLEEGAVIYTGCEHYLQPETPSAAFKIVGSWVEVIYLPERRESLVMVFDGAVEARPVLDFGARTLGGPVDVPAGYFWFTDPGATADTVAGLAGRVPHPFDQLPTVIEELRLEPWIQRSRDHAEKDAIPFPDWMTCAPGVLYCEDFEDGLAQGWSQHGWIMERDGSNHVFSGSSEGEVWTGFTGGESWGEEYRVRLRFRISQWGFTLEYPLSNGSYHVSFAQMGVSLSKETAGRQPVELTRTPFALLLNSWYQAEIVRWRGHFQVYVDGALKLEYTDEEPLAHGTIALYTGAGRPGGAQVDDIEVLPAGPS